MNKLILGVYLLLLSGLCTAQPGEWINYQPDPWLFTIKNDANNLWIGTYNNGLAKFDKNKESFTWFRTDNSPLTGNTIYALATDKSGNLWIGTKNLITYDGNTWIIDTTKFSQHSGEHVSAIAIDSAANVWYGVYDTIIKSDGEKRTVTNIGQPYQSSFDISDILFDKQGFVWLSTNWGVEKFDGANLIDYGDKIYANCMALDKSGRLWIGNQEGLICCDGTNRIYFTSENSELPDDHIHCMQFDSAGILWIGTNRGLARFDGSSWKTFNTENSGLPEDQITVMDIDDQGIIWLGLAHYGIIKFDGINWRNYHFNDRMIPSGVIFDIEVGADHSIWIGSKAGLIKYDKKGWLYYNGVNSGLPGDYILSLKSDNNNLWIGNSWIGSQGPCLSVYDGKNWQAFGEISGSISFEVNSINALEMDPEGNLWIGTEYDGLIKFNGAEWTLYNPENSGLPSDRVTQLVHDGQDNLWIGTVELTYWQGTPDERNYAGGLAKLNNGIFTVYNKNNTSLPHSSIGAMAIDSSGYVWMSTFTGNTFGGLTRFDGKSWTTFNTSNTILTHDRITSIQADRENNLWVGSFMDGLIKIDANNKWTNYTTENSDILADYVRTVAIDHEDNKWISFGHGEGLSVFKEGGVSLDVGGKAEIPNGYQLYQNYPNPFNGRTIIKYKLPESSWVEMKTYNILGEEISTLVDKYQPSGINSVIWEINKELMPLASEIFFYRIKAGNFVKTGKMILIKRY